MLDLDGTVYRGDEPIGGAFEALARIRSRGLPFVFLTNNATSSRADFAAKLTRMGFECGPERIVSSAWATGQLLAERYPPGRRAYVIGAPALEEEVRCAGFRIADRRPDVVVVGLDRDLTYAKLRIGVRAILAGADFVATNPDRLIPAGAELDPGAGAIVAAVHAATSHVTTPLVVGKPEPHMPNLALRLLGTRPEQTVLVGDQVATDIRAGAQAGMFTVLVETGVPAPGTHDVLPDRVVANLLDISLGQ